MLKALLKKQFYELNSSFFQDKKKGKARSKTNTIVLIALYAFLMIGVLGGSFFAVGLGMCPPLLAADAGWLYFIIMGMISLFLGVFGSVFNTYSGLYNAKDNNLLLSMPIPIRYILIARLSGVYLMGLMFSSVAMVPSSIVYWVYAPITFMSILGPIIVTLMISFLVLVLSCILGFAVACVSRKLKNKSLATVLLSLLGIGLYYFIYFRANTLLREIAENAASIGKGLKSDAYILYLFGRAGEGDILGLLLFSAIVLVLVALVCWVIARSFLKIATSSGVTVNRVYHEKKVKPKSIANALLFKELVHLGSSANYMLNCALGSVMTVLAAIAALIFIKDISLLLILFADAPQIIPVACCGLLFLFCSMNDLTAPSISLEGRSIWICQHLPVAPWEVLKAKINLHLLLTSPCILLLQVAVLLVVKPTGLDILWILLLPQLFILLLAEFGLFVNLHKPDLNWTSEVIAVKQNVSPLLSIFGGWGYSILLFIFPIINPFLIPVPLYLCLCTLLTLALVITLYFWLKKRGSHIFSTL